MNICIWFHCVHGEQYMNSLYERVSAYSHHKPFTLLSVASLVFVLAGCGDDNDLNPDEWLKNNPDTTAPVITISGDNPSTLAYDTTYVDAGATAIDDVDGSVSVTTNGTINVTLLGTQTITYTATDSSGNSAEAIRTVNVIDSIAPVITLVGNAEVDLFINDTYTDAGATASDNADSSVTVTSSNDLDTSIVGVYTYTYDATDTSGNDATSVTRTITVSAPVLTGTAAAGAAIVGTVTVKDALGNTRSAVIEANGDYSVDVSGLTAPFRLRAEGTVGGKTYKLHSYAESATPESTVNITPFTDLIISNAAQQVAEEFFDEATPTALDPEEIDEQENALQAKLQDVFNAVGLDSAIDLLNMSFSADHSGLDAALDLINIETDPDTNTATITNILDGSSIEDDISDTEDNDTVIVIDEDDATESVSDTIAIANVFKAFGDKFVDGLPSADAITLLLADSFLHEDQSRGEFVTEVTTDPSLIDLSFTSVSVRDLDSTAGTATVDFNVKFGDEIEAQPETWYVTKVESSWKLNGNQLAVEADTLNFHCNDYDGTDSSTGGCGLNVSFYDNDFTNNGTDGEALASATMTIVDGETGEIKDVVYLGTPDDNGAGEIHVYNHSSGYYQGDYVGFGDEGGDVDPSIFAVGDIIEYRVYEANLDLSDPALPVVDEGNEAISFSDTLLFLPKTTGLYPSVTNDTLVAIEAFSPDEDLTVAWTLASGTSIDSILVEVYDEQGNRYDIEDETVTDDDTSVNIDVSSLFSDGTLDEDNFTLLVRVYAFEPQIGQYHSTDYRTTFSEDPTGGGEGGGTAGLTCDTESNWDDINDKPLDFYSIDDFYDVIADCASESTPPGFSMGDLANVTWYVEDERVVFDASGQNLVITAFGDDETLDTSDDETFYGVVSDYDTNILQFSYSETQGGTIIGIDLIRITGESSFGGVDIYEVVTLWEYFEWGESDDGIQDTSADTAEIYHDVFALSESFDRDAWESGEVPSSGTALACDTESDWDDVNDKPFDFYSIDDFESVIAACASEGTLPNFGMSELENLTWYSDDERLVFDGTGQNFVITDYGDDEVLGTADDEDFYGEVSEYSTNILQFSYSETQGGDSVGVDLIRITSESSFGGIGVYAATILWEEFDWNESDGDLEESSHEGGEIYHGAFSVSANFDWNSWYSQ